MLGNVSTLIILVAMGGQLLRHCLGNLLSWMQTWTRGPGRAAGPQQGFLTLSSLRVSLNVKIFLVPPQVGVCAWSDYVFCNCSLPGQLPTLGKLKLVGETGAAIFSGCTQRVVYTLIPAAP